MNEPGSSQYKYSFNINTAINSAFGDNARVEVHYHSRESKNTSDLTREQVLAAFHRANAELRTYNNQIAGVHLARPEVAQIVDWALSANAQEKLGILIDQPGGGKTVVMRDILEELETRGVPVLAIKADWLTGVRNGDDLASRLGLPAAVEICAELLSSDGPCFFLIDQLDALSLALSRDQATLDVMMSLIARLREMSNVRVIDFMSNLRPT